MGDRRLRFLVVFPLRFVNFQVTATFEEHGGKRKLETGEVFTVGAAKRNQGSFSGSRPRADGGRRRR